MSYSCHSIKKSYHQGEKEISILRGIDFQWKEEQIVGIVGESGSGKSTLLSIFSGLLRPNQGEVVIEDTSLYQLDKKSLSEFRAKNIGIIFQQYHLIPDLTLTENILLPLELNGLPVDLNELDWWLERLGLSHRRDHFPYQLSGGEQQRVAIARAFIHKPKIVFADEPSGSLDEGTGSQIMSLLFNIVRERKAKMFLVTHSPSLAKLCDKVYRVEEGRLNEVL